MATKDSRSRLYKIKILAEILLVLTVVFGIKWITDYFKIIGAGSIAIWFGIITATFFMKQRKIRWYDFGLMWPKGRKQWLIQIGLGFVAIISIIFITALILFVIEPIFGIERAPDAADRFNFFLGKPIVFITYLVTIVWFGAGLGEELLMRGFVLNQLKCFIGNYKLGWVVAIILHSILFGYMHSYQGSAGMIITGFISFFFGLIYLFSGRKLFPVVFAHIIFDTTTMLAFYLNNGA